jgi:hypothetical protein
MMLSPNSTFEERVAFLHSLNLTKRELEVMLQLYRGNPIKLRRDLVPVIEQVLREAN